MIGITTAKSAKRSIFQQFESGSALFRSYVLHLLWMTSFFHLMEQIGHAASKTTRMFCSVHQMAAPGRSRQIEKHWNSVLLSYMQCKTNNGDSGTAAAGCNAPDWSVLGLHITLCPWKICPCDAAFCHNYLTICLLYERSGRPKIFPTVTWALESTCRCPWRSHARGHWTVRTAFSYRSRRILLTAERLKHLLHLLRHVERRLSFDRVLVDFEILLRSSALTSGLRWRNRRRYIRPQLHIQQFLTRRMDTGTTTLPPVPIKLLIPSNIRQLLTAQRYKTLAYVLG